MSIKITKKPVKITVRNTGVTLTAQKNIVSVISVARQGMTGGQGEQGVAGLDGDSAYEVAVANGFVGTEQAWLDSLVGADGQDGAQGIQGIQGEKGDKGDTGEQGAQGIQGVAGQDGADGLDSPFQTDAQVKEAYERNADTNAFTDADHAKLDGIDLTPYALETYVDAAVAGLVDSSPEALDTLNELAAALGDDPNFSTTVTSQIAGKQDQLVSGTNIKTINSTTILGSGNLALATEAQGLLADSALQSGDNISELNNDAGYTGDQDLSPYATIASLAAVATSGDYDDLTNKPNITAGAAYETFWAEESVALNSGAFEWSFGNGDETPNGEGVVVLRDCTLIAAGLQIGEGSATVEVYINSTATGLTASASGTDGTGFTDGASIALSAGDTINFRTTATSGNSTGGRASAMVRYGDTQALSALNDLDDVTITTPSNRQGLVYNSSTGEWENSTPSYNDLSDTPTIPTNNNQLTNGAGYITGYTVTEADVTAHQAALSIAESQITGLNYYNSFDSDFAAKDTGDLSEGSNLYFTNARAQAAVDLSDYVTGAASSTDNAIARYDGTTGKVIQNSGATISDDGITLTIGDATDNIVSVGVNNDVTGVTQKGVTLGANNIATGFAAAAIGVDNEGGGRNIGFNNSMTSGDGIGRNNIGEGISIGSACTSHLAGIAMGASSQATASNSLCFGQFSSATDTFATAFGSFANATGFLSFALGVAANASGNTSLSIGRSANASGANSSVFGVGQAGIVDNSTDNSLMFAYDDTNFLMTATEISCSFGQVFNNDGSISANAYDTAINALGDITGAVEIDLADGAYITATLTGAITPTFTGLPAAGYNREFTLAFTNVETITYPAGTRFAGGVAPTIIGTDYEISCGIDSAGTLTVYGVVDAIS